MIQRGFAFAVIYPYPATLPPAAPAGEGNPAGVP